jgi:hypothetical protein
MPDRDQWMQFLDGALRHVRGESAPGLSDRELGAVEAAVGVKLPTELRIMLQLPQPLGRSWRDWRPDPAAVWATWRAYVTDGLVFDVAHNGFWDRGWGARPAGALDREAITRRQAETLPRLFPVYGHRGLAIEPVLGLDSADGNPVFSVHQTDVIYYGNDLADWFNHEYGVPLPDWAATEPRRIPFWSSLCDPERWSEPPAWP